MKKLFNIIIVASLTLAHMQTAFAGLWSSETDWEKTGSEDRGERYKRNVKKRGDIVTYEILEDLYSPMTHDSKIIRSMIYYNQIDCQRKTQRITTLEFFSKQMAAGNSWAGPTSKEMELHSSAYNKYCL